jgi:putative SOS response-associated peptidase YedK
MCGRYASAKKAEDLAESFGIRSDNVHGDIDADFNVAPTKPVFTVVDRVPRRHRDSAGQATSEASTDSDAPQRQLRIARWGLVPSWAKDPSIGNRLINARLETAADKPAFRGAFRTRRCLLPADGYYEWWPATGADGKAVKQPFFIHPRDGGTLAMAGLYEFWRDSERADDDPEAWLFTVTVLTTSAPDDLGRIHDRMPLMVEPDRWQRWLDPAEQDPATVRELLTPARPGLLEAYAVSRDVNDVRRNGAHLLDPLGRDEVPADLPVSV